MKALLIYPEFTDTFWSFKYALKFISKKSGIPPLGLLTVAAMLPKEWELKVIDMTTTNLNDSDIMWADYVFISAMAIQRASTNKVIDKVKRFGKKIVAGGPLFTSGQEDFPKVDHFLIGEAELTIPDFLADLKDGHLKKTYTANQWADIKKTPIPLWHLINMKRYASMCIQYSRGCPFDCDFCDITLLYGRKVRVKTTQQIIAELESIYSLGWRGEVFFVDDNFIAKKGELKREILPAIIEWMTRRRNPFIFSTQTSINLSDDDELMHLMVKAGFNVVFIGIETPNQESLAECGKLQNKNRNLINCVKKIQAQGMQVQGGFIVGFDNDQPSIFKRLIEFIQDSGIATAMVGLLNAPRGTRLYKRLIEEKRILKDITGDNTDYSLNFIPKMNITALLDGYKEVLNTIYSPKYYYNRVLTLLRNLKPLQKKKYKFHFYHIGAFLKSIWFLGILGKGKRYYWKLFFWSLFRRPRLFPLAITYAIYGFHFRMVFGIS